MTVKDLGQVMMDLGEAAEKWHEIGTVYKISATFLEELKAQGKGNEASLLAVITQWLGGANARPTWESMLDVLRDKEVGKDAVAQQLDNKYSLSDKNSGKFALTFVQYLCN